MANKITEIRAGMTCSGCSGAITRILTKVDGVESVDCDIEKNQVMVHHTDAVTGEQLVEKLKNWASASGRELALISTQDA
ncbi:Metal homeostasis factor ATX1, putative [Perkinsus marinus ATCC 50983]|uniref:Metal homeostasis factor ATX1, putative n=3 Tax=Perkinsus marinus TaxID=31276 RepID=C5LS23_PERM5|nr:Metal homeostasis factor ATX1, putative [Perkinsus marinus ATCC 50983]ABV22185.1 unknown [Perkinsus marinus]EER00495.1 Metal homeostasis factor ATX1, putative [Perkinsus marinus ATCC 50983]|mmetsp:Transcript_24389/g.24117  ORF Transcript_24389/g.24117 Transcript_24389/m.24117 type:complete len:80 (-) Transcript_24389:78-317(-)|eukprot:XP_002767777.1 Metal homeostasis factor ATX1, putative [Perkinsus marinus ATCC 50983]